MKKKVGFLYDNISRNTGDLAIGLSVKKIILESGIKEKYFEEMIPGISNPNNFENIIIGGGLLLREKRDFYYDKFRLEGKYILNCMGIFQEPKDLDYLKEYKYVSVHSKGDRKKLSYIDKQIQVVPDTTLLLDDVDLKIKIKNPSIGIHCFSQNNFKDINKIIRKYSKHFFIYLLPITHYNYDFEFLKEIYLNNFKNKNVQLLPILNPLEINTIIGKFSYFISYSLHGAYFAYKHQTPFILLDDGAVTKMKEFMEDRKLENFLFSDSGKIDKKLTDLIENPPNYQMTLKKDMKILQKHQLKIKKIITSASEFYPTKIYPDLKTSQWYSKFNKSKQELIPSLSNQIIKLSRENRKLKNLNSELKIIKDSQFFKLWKPYCKIKKIFKFK